MELKLKNGDYVPDGAGGLRRLEGREALLQRVLFRLTARRGSFPFWETLGSRLGELGRLPAAARPAAARQYVAEALAEETGVTVENVTLEPGGRLTAGLRYEGGVLPVTVEVLACGERTDEKHRGDL